jgi:hypothetical protein
VRRWFSVTKEEEENTIEKRRQHALFTYQAKSLPL